MVGPVHSLNIQHQVSGIEFLRRISADDIARSSGFKHRHPPLLYQTGTNATCAETLRVKNVLKLHELILHSFHPPKAETPLRFLAAGGFGLME